jgi:DNA polymerase V
MCKNGNLVISMSLRVSGESMKDAGINHGDILVVDRSLEASSGRMSAAT